MQQSIRDAVMEFLRKQRSPVTRQQVAAALPDRPPNSVNRMLRDLVNRGTAVETREGFSLKLLALGTESGGGRGADSYGAP